MLSLSSLDLGSSFSKDSFLRVVHFVKFVEIEIGSLNNFDLSDFNVLNGIDGADFFGDLLFNYFTGEEVEDLGSVGLSNFFGDDFINLLSDDFLL